MNIKDLLPLYNEVMHFNSFMRTDEERSTVQYLKDCAGWYTEEGKETLDATNPIDHLDGIADMFVTLVQLNDSLGVDAYWTCRYFYNHLTVGEYTEVYDIPGAIGEVNRSNFSKIPFLQDVLEMYKGEYQSTKGALKSYCEVLNVEYEGKYRGITYNVVGDNTGAHRVVFKDENRKLMKPTPFYSEPSLQSFIL